MPYELRLNNGRCQTFDTEEEAVAHAGEILQEHPDVEVDIWDATRANLPRRVPASLGAKRSPARSGFSSRIDFWRSHEALKPSGWFGRLASTPTTGQAQCQESQQTKHATSSHRIRSKELPFMIGTAPSSA